MEEPLNWNSIPQCRLCGRFGPHKIDIFGNNAYHLVDKIFKCTGIRVERCDKSTKTCQNCFIEINNFAIFREMCSMTNVHMKMVVSLNRLDETTVDAVHGPSITESNGDDNIGDDNIGDGLNAVAAVEPDRRADDRVVEKVKPLKRKISDVNASKPMTNGRKKMRSKPKENHSDVDLKPCSVVLDRLPLELPPYEAEEPPADEAEEPPAIHSREVVQCDNELNNGFELNGPLGGIDAVDPLKMENASAAVDDVQGDNLLDVPLMNGDQTEMNAGAIVGSPGPSAGPSSAKKPQKKKDKTRVKRIGRKFPTKCSCSNLFENSDAMLFHQQDYHAEGVEKTFECHFCKKTFAYHSVLQVHFRTAHSVKRFECTFPMCLKSFKNKYVLNSHINAVHTKANVYNCTKCSSHFYLQSSLSRHNKSQHATERGCHLCQEKFPTLVERDQHLHTAHNVVRIKCTFPMCTKTFAKEKYMLDHQKKCPKMVQGGPLEVANGDEAMQINESQSVLTFNSY